MDYDICIIGAGIAGLYCARELTKHMPDAKICIMEKYKYIGGRTNTFRKVIPGHGKVQWEAGAGRIHESHTQLLDLLKEYGIDIIPIHGGPQWREPGKQPVAVEFGSYIKNLNLKSIPESTLMKHTLNDVLEKVIGQTITRDMTSRYEYRSELDTLRADKAVRALEHELGFHSNYFVVKGGFSTLVKALKQDIEKRDVKILREHEVSNIELLKNNTYRVSVKSHISIHASKVVVAIPRDDAVKLPCLRRLDIMDKVAMRPLVRMYAIFPLVNGKVWFDGINSFVCPPPIRYTIPMNPKQGTIMISYTDGKDAEYWIDTHKNKGEAAILSEIMEQMRGLFPSLDIPDPIFFKIHEWSDGCSYWVPGAYDFDKMSKASVHPLPDTMPGLYMCNESWAYNQCWVECAIDQAKHAINAIMNV